MTDIPTTPCIDCDRLPEKCNGECRNNPMHDYIPASPYTSGYDDYFKTGGEKSLVAFLKYKQQQKIKDTQRISEKAFENFRFE